MSATSISLLQPVRLWKHSPDHERRATWLELFFDLIFVAALAQLGSALVHEYTLRGALEYCFRFALVWWAWYGHTMYSTRFDVDDAAQRVLTVLQVFAAAVMAANARGGLDSRDSAGFTAAYAGMRAILFVQYWRARRIHSTRSLVHRHMAIIGSACLLWIAAALLPAPLRYFAWALAIATELFEPCLGSTHLRETPPDPHHLPERFGLFTIILLGEFVAAIMRGMEKQENWPPPAVLAAFASLSIGFMIWWWYFLAVDAARPRHTGTHSDVRRFQLWTAAHFALYISIVTFGVGLEHIVALPMGSAIAHTEKTIFVGAAALLATSMLVIELASHSGYATLLAYSGRLLLPIAALTALSLVSTMEVYVLIPCVTGIIAACVVASQATVKSTNKRALESVYAIGS